MNRYAIYYSYKEMGDVVVIVFDSDKSVTKTETKGRVEVFYHDNQIIRYNIKNVKEIIKIKNEGLIFLPSPTLIEILNSILINEGLKPLEELKDSGYFVAKVIDKKDNRLTLSLGDETYQIESSSEVNIHDVVVIAKQGTFLNTQKVVDDSAHICTYKELGINENEDKTLILDSDIDLGKDFFSLEAK